MEPYVLGSSSESATKFNIDIRYYSGPLSFRKFFLDCRLRTVVQIRKIAPMPKLGPLFQGFPEGSRFVIYMG
jgi:hypothetical protein